MVPKREITFDQFMKGPDFSFTLQNIFTVLRLVPLPQMKDVDQKVLYCMLNGHFGCIKSTDPELFFQSWASWGLADALLSYETMSPLIIENNKAMMQILRTRNANIIGETKVYGSQNEVKV